MIKIIAFPVIEPKFFESYPEDKIAAIKQLASEEPGLAEILANAESLTGHATAAKFRREMKSE